MASSTVENGARNDQTEKMGVYTDWLFIVNSDDIGPIQEYDRRVAAGRLRNDEHQRGRPP